MALQDFLRPSESIQYRSPSKVNYQGENYFFYITDSRLIWHIRKGRIFKKDAFVAAPLESVGEISYKEKGLFRKEATISFNMSNEKKIELSGKPKSIRAIYQEIQPLMASPSTNA